MEKVDYQEAMDRTVEVCLVKMMVMMMVMINQQIHVWMRRLLMHSVMRESVPVPSDGWSEILNVKVR